MAKRRELEKAATRELKRACELTSALGAGFEWINLADSRTVRKREKKKKRGKGKEEKEKRKKKSCKKKEKKDTGLGDLREERNEKGKGRGADVQSDGSIQLEPWIELRRIN